MNTEKIMIWTIELLFLGMLAALVIIPIGLALQGLAFILGLC